MAWHRAELARLEQEQRDDLLRLLRVAFGTGVMFHAIDVWLNDDLRIACLEAGLASPRALGIALRAWRDQGIARIGVDELGARWIWSD